VLAVSGCTAGTSPNNSVVAATPPTPSARDQQAQVTPTPVPTPTSTGEATAAPTAKPTLKPTPKPTPKPVAKATLRPKPPSNCHPSYSGVCLTLGIGDYDCAGGSGNGPNYVDGPVRVVGPDDFDLDRDNDGIGCE